MKMVETPGGIGSTFRKRMQGKTRSDNRESGTGSGDTGPDPYDVDWGSEMESLVSRNLDRGESPYGPWFDWMVSEFGDVFLDEYRDQAKWVAGTNLVNAYLYHDRATLDEDNPAYDEEAYRKSSESFGMFYQLTRAVPMEDARVAGAGMSHALAWHDVIDMPTDRIPDKVDPGKLLPVNNQDTDKVREYVHLYIDELFTERKHRDNRAVLDVQQDPTWLHHYDCLLLVEDQLGLQPSDPSNGSGFAFDITRGFQYHSMAVEVDSDHRSEYYRRALYHIRRGQEALYANVGQDNTDLLPPEKRSRQQDLFVKNVRYHDDYSSTYRRLVNDPSYTPRNADKPLYRVIKEEGLKHAPIVQTTAEMAEMIIDEAIA